MHFHVCRCIFGTAEGLYEPVGTIPRSSGLVRTYLHGKEIPHQASISRVRFLSR